MKKRKKQKLATRRLKAKAKAGKLVGDVICNCYACHKPVAVLYDKKNEPNGLAHASLVENQFGPNGETGCEAFDKVGATADDMVEYLVKCREAAEAKRLN